MGTEERELGGAGGRGSGGEIVGPKESRPVSGQLIIRHLAPPADRHMGAGERGAAL